MLLFGMIQGLVNIWALSNYDFDLSAKYESLWSIYQKAIQTQKLQKPRPDTANDYELLKTAVRSKTSRNGVALRVD
jgi:hypothetical protein